MTPGSGRTVVEPLFAQVLELLDEPERELLQRCSVPRSFDFATVADVLMPGANPKLLGGLVDIGLIEAAGSSYRVAPALREIELGTLAADVFRELSAQLGERWRAERPDEAFYHLLVSDPERAASLFTEQYETAEEKFDLAGCETLLAILEERLTELDPGLRALRDEYRVRFARHLQWSSDWYRTRRFLKRKNVAETFGKLLEGGGGRVMTLVARGGMGKTMHLRWLAARVCVPESIPYARIDFDDVVADVALEEPWLVLAAFAEQLNNQVERTALADLLTADARQALLRFWRVTAGRAGAGRRSPRDRRDERTLEQFASALRTLPPDRPVVLVLDTLEVASLRTQSSLAPLMEHLRLLRDACPAVRLLFAGRFDLVQEVPEAGELLGNAVPLNLKPFEPEERRDYLTRIRGFDDAEVVETITSRSDGNPFKLALIADLVEDAKELSPADIAAYADVDLPYLLDRILLRIDEMDVRWVLRYGAMARTLDRDLLERAMRPVLEREMEAESRDRIEKGLQPNVAATWERRGAPTDFEPIWAALRRYEKEASWVRVVGEPPDEVLQFGVDVLEPMRRLVSQQPVFAELHELLADEFKRRARADRRRGDGWGRITAQELYHRIRLDPEEGCKLALERLGEADRRGLEVLVDDLLSREYAVLELFGEPDDDAGPNDQRPKPTPKLVAELLHLRLRLLLLNVVGFDDAAWVRCQEPLVRLQRMREHSPDVFDAARLVPLQAALALRVPNREDGHRREVAERWTTPLRAATAKLSDQQERVRALLLLAELYGHDQEDAATQTYKRALDAVRSSGRVAFPGVRPVSATTVRQRLAEHLSRAGNARDALQIVRSARKDVSEKSVTQAHLKLQEARFLITCGRPNAAAALADEMVGSSSGPARLHGVVIRARALVAARRPEEATRTGVKHGFSWMTSEVDPDVVDRRLAEFSAVRAAGFAAQGLVDEAFDALEEGEECKSARAGAPARLLLGTQLQVELRTLGDYRAAESTLKRAAAVVEGADDYRALVLRLQRVEWLAGSSGASTAAEELARVAAALEAGSAPRLHRIRLAVEGVVLGYLDPYLPMLTEHLAKVEPSTARIALLRELARADRLPRGAGAAALRDIVVSLDARAMRSVDEADRRLLRLVGADVMRVAQGNAAAAEELGKVQGGGLGVDADWLGAAARTGLAHGTMKRARGLLDRLEHKRSPLATDAALAVAEAIDSQRGYDYLALDAMAIADRTLLRHPVARPGRAHARLAELRARHADGPDAEEAARALGIYEQLGDASGVDRTRALASQAAHGPRDDTLPISAGEVPGWLGPMMFAEADEAVPWPLLQILNEDWMTLAGRLTRLVSAMVERRFATPVDRATLVIAQSGAHVVPWELGAGRDGRIALSRGLDAAGSHSALLQLLDEGAVAGADTGGTVSADTVVRMWRDISDVRHAEPRVLLVAPSATFEDRALRGSEDWVGRAFDAYMAAGFDVTYRPLEEDVSALGLEPEPLALVHVLAPFVDSEGDAAIDLTGAGGAYSAESTGGEGGRPLHVHAFRRLLEPAGVPGIRPLLVLDPPLPPSDFEVGIQLCLRNAFAGALFDSGAFTSIVATGLLPSEVRGVGYRTLADALGDGVSVGHATERLRRAVRKEFPLPERDTLGPRAIAAFNVHDDLPAPLTTPWDR